MKLTIDCAMCGEDREITLKCDGVDSAKTIREIVIEEGWIAQQNGPHFDIYCCARCAQ